MSRAWLIAYMAAFVFSGFVGGTLWQQRPIQECDCAPCEGEVTVDDMVYIDLPDRLWERTAKDCGGALASMRASLDSCMRGEKTECRRDLLGGAAPCPDCPDCPKLDPVIRWGDGGLMDGNGKITPIPWADPQTGTTPPSTPVWPGGDQ
jgi:hypothetical protein